MMVSFLRLLERRGAGPSFPRALDHVISFADAGVDSSRVRRLGIPDRYIEHGERDELLADLGLDAAGIAAACRRLAAGASLPALPK